MIKIDDRILTKRMGFWISEGISGATFSKFSHIEPILNSQGDSIDATFPKIKRSNISQYFDGKHRVRIIRPLPSPLFGKEDIYPLLCSPPPLSFLFKRVALNQLELEGWYVNCIKKIGKWYNLFKRNCASVCFDADRAVGRLMGVSIKTPTPEMHNLLAEVGCEFEIVYDAYKPNKEDFKKLREV